MQTRGGSGIRRTALMVTIAVALLASACGRSSETSQGPDVQAPDTTAEVGTTLPESPAGPEGGTTLPPATVAPLPPVTKPKPTPTTKIPPKPTAPKPTLPKATTTTRAPGPTQPPLDVKQFCDFISTLDFSGFNDANWSESFIRVHDALNGSVGTAPASVKQALLDLKATLDAVRPAVEAGQITSSAQLIAWFSTLDGPTQDRITAAYKQLGLYTLAHCQ